MEELINNMLEDKIKKLEKLGYDYSKQEYNIDEDEEKYCIYLQGQIYTLIILRENIKLKMGGNYGR